VLVVIVVLVESSKTDLQAYQGLIQLSYRKRIREGEKNSKNRKKRARNISKESQLQNSTKMKNQTSMSYKNLIES
jgi:hypothetical protein